jgi:hypothetical protein
MDRVCFTSGKGFITVKQGMSAGDNTLNTGDNAYPALDHAFSAGSKPCGAYGKHASPSFIPSPATSHSSLAQLQ